MDWLREVDVGKFLLFTLVLTRVSGLTMTAPVFGSRDVPMQVRAFLAFALALLITPTQWHVSVEHPRTMINYLTFLGSELLIGLCLGLGIVVLMSGIQLAGALVSRIGGMMLAEVFDPSAEANVPMFSRMMLLVATAVFLCIGGHRILMAGLLDTFQSIPPGSSAFAESIGEAFVELVTQSFSLGIRASIPVVTALLLSTLVMGLISRTLPQLNILMVGFGMNSMLTFAMMSFTLGGAVWVFQDQIEPAMKVLLDSLHAPLRAEWLS